MFVSVFSTHFINRVSEVSLYSWWFKGNIRKKYLLFMLIEVMRMREKKYLPSFNTYVEEGIIMSFGCLQVKGSQIVL